MLAIQKNNEVMEKLNKSLFRLKNLSLAKDSFLTYLLKTNLLQKSYSKKIWNSMTQFQQKIVKLTFYSSQKVKKILNFSKIYRQFAYHWQKISKVNICNLEQLSSQDIESSQKLVEQKARIFLEELKKYSSDEKIYNKFYVVYKKNCTKLNQDIQKFRQYSDPLCFYNEKVTSDFLQNLMKKHEHCNTQQMKLKTQLQLLDTKRHYLSQYLGEAKQAYVSTFEKNLKALHFSIKYVIDPSKDQAIQKQDFKLKSDIQQQNYLGDIQNLLSSQQKNEKQNDQNQGILIDFKQLFNNQEKTISQITSDQKFFYDRAINIKNKKSKRSNQMFIIQALLIDQIRVQMVNFKQFQNQFKNNEKQVFGSDGMDSYNKKFRKYFGKNFHHLYQLCVLISESRKNSIQKIYKIMENSLQKLQNTFKQKKENLKFFENQTNIIMQAHRKLKQKIGQNNDVTNEARQQYKKNVLISSKQITKIYKQLQQHEKQMDSLFFKTIKQISDTILKQAIFKSLGKLIQKQKNRMQILRHLNIMTQAQTSLYQDIKYQLFFNQQLIQNLSKCFKSQIQTKKFNQTKITLLQKQNTLNGMIKHKTTCCGIKSQPLTANLKESFDCSLIIMREKVKQVNGSLNVLANGVNFLQKSWNIFASLLQIIVPNKDIENYKTQVIQGKQFLTIITKKGPVYFYGPEVQNIFASMIKHLGLKIVEKQMSQKNPQNRSSMSSFLGNSGSQQFRLQFDRSTSQSMRNDRKKNSPLKKKTSSNVSEFRINEQLLQRLSRKLMSQKFFSTSFNEIAKQIPIKDPSRFNYNFKQDVHKFLLKQKKRLDITSSVLSFDYSWKVSFPQNIMLKSFKHYQTVYIEIQKNKVKIQIVHGVNFQNVSLGQKVFYQQVQHMNDNLIAYIVNYTEKQGDICIRPDKQSEFGSSHLIEPNNIILNLQNEPSLRIDRNYSSTGQNFYINNKHDKSASTFTNMSTKH